MTEPPGSTLVRALAERITEAIAPDEIEMFPALADVYENKPEALLSRRGYRDEPLGFGIGEVGRPDDSSSFLHCRNGGKLSRSGSLIA